MKEIDLSTPAATAKARFGAFLIRVGDAHLLHGMQKVPVSELSTTLSFVGGAKASEQLVPFPVLDAACKLALSAADLVLAGGPNVHGLTRDDIAAINFYTQETLFSINGEDKTVYGILNAALREESREVVKPFWGYIKLLQMALFKLPKESTNTVLHRGIKVRWGPENHSGPVSLSDQQKALRELEAKLRAKQRTGEPEIWWGFSSTSTSLDAVKAFLGQDGPRVIYTIAAWSSARDVRKYSCFQDGDVPEEERLLPCGTAFAVDTLTSLTSDLLMVSLRQLDDVLLQPP
eukprot:COSAG02_NODE_16334_length_1092_cov_0.969789_1_plen_289_part_10